MFVFYDAMQKTRDFDNKDFAGFNSNLMSGFMKF